MEMRQFGPNGPQLPVIGLGTWQMEHDPDPASAIQAAVSHGMTHIDTAEMYGDGSVEDLVGQSIKGLRDQIYLVSKVMPFTASRRGTIRACEQSLRRLQTDRLDLYLLHWPGSEPLEETVAAFEQLRDDGKIRSFGVSNFDVADMEDLLRVTDAGNIACNQVLYHPAERAIEYRVLPFCTRHNIPVVAYSPVGQGKLLDRKTPGGKVIAEIAEQRAVSVYQVALRFVVRDPNVFAIPKTSRVEHLLDNAKAGTWELSASEIEQLEAACPQPEHGGLPML